MGISTDCKALAHGPLLGFQMLLAQLIALLQALAFNLQLLPGGEARGKQRDMVERLCIFNERRGFLSNTPQFGLHLKTDTSFFQPAKAVLLLLVRVLGEEKE